MKYHIGQIVDGIVSSRQPFGAFLRLDDDDFGLLKLPNAQEIPTSPAPPLPPVGTQLTCVVIAVEETAAGARVELSRRKADFQRLIP